MSKQYEPDECEFTAQDLCDKKGKKSEERISTRKLKILELVCNEPNGLSFQTLVKTVGEEYRVHEETIKSDVVDLSNRFPIKMDKENVCVSSLGMGKMWSGTAIGERFGKSESKKKLAKATFSFIKANKMSIAELVLGTGTTVYECAKELINGESDLNDMKIYTDNLMVLYEFICCKPNKLFLGLPKGELNKERAALRGPDTVKYFRNLNIDAVVTSFSDMSFEKGFCTIYEDNEEKLANLRPKSNRCRWIIIPIEWRKIGISIGTPVAESRKKQLDLRKTYVIITDKPSDNQKWDPVTNDNKLKELDAWQTAYPENIKIIYAQ